mmetsp:Transcript_144177/g.251273  ORF Transcript_144177/g.251273 Transcript_144177/m.251273 type:complete len:1485 (-) Transcript_144177:76-4530(-)
MSDLAECALCCNTFKEEPQERVPRSLPCGHTFCHECLSRLVIRNSVECPNRCTVNANLGVEGVAGLPRNFALIDTLRARRPPDAGSTELARLEEEKRRAVEAEDYDLAKKLKVEIDALKAGPGPPCDARCYDLGDLGHLVRVQPSAAAALPWRRPSVVCVLDRSPSMGQTVDWAVNYAMPTALEQIGYRQDDPVVLITFDSIAERVHIAGRDPTVSELRTIGVKLRGRTTLMADAMKLLVDVLSAGGAFNVFVISDGFLKDMAQTLQRVEAEISRVPCSARIAFSLFRFFNGKPPDTQALAAAASLGTIGGAPCTDCVIRRELLQEAMNDFVTTAESAFSPTMGRHAMLEGTTTTFRRLPSMAQVRRVEIPCDRESFFVIDGSVGELRINGRQVAVEHETDLGPALADYCTFALAQLRLWLVGQVRKEDFTRVTRWYRQLSELQDRSVSKSDNSLLGRALALRRRRADDESPLARIEALAEARAWVTELNSKQQGDFLRGGSVARADRLLARRGLGSDIVYHDAVRRALSGFTTGDDIDRVDSCDDQEAQYVSFFGGGSYNDVLKAAAHLSPVAEDLSAAEVMHVVGGIGVPFSAQLSSQVNNPWAIEITSVDVGSWLAESDVWAGRNVGEPLLSNCGEPIAGVVPLRTCGPTAHAAYFEGPLRPVAMMQLGSQLRGGLPEKTWGWDPHSPPFAFEDGVAAREAAVLCFLIAKCFGLGKTPSVVEATLASQLLAQLQAWPGAQQASDSLLSEEMNHLKMNVPRLRHFAAALGTAGNLLPSTARALCDLEIRAALQRKGEDLALHALDARRQLVLNLLAENPMGQSTPIAHDVVLRKLEQHLDHAAGGEDGDVNSSTSHDSAIASDAEIAKRLLALTWLPAMDTIIGAARVKQSGCEVASLSSAAPLSLASAFFGSHEQGEAGLIFVATVVANTLIRSTTGAASGQESFLQRVGNLESARAELKCLLHQVLEADYEARLRKEVAQLLIQRSEEAKKRMQVHPSEASAHGPQTELCLEAIFPAAPFGWGSSSGQPHIACAFCGDAGAGKSTAAGRLLYELGRIAPRSMQQYMLEANRLGKASSAFAFAMDKMKTERECGASICLSKAHFYTDRWHYTLVDCPARPGLIKNTLRGFAQADVGVLMVPASGSYQALAKGNHRIGESPGQARQHARLLNIYGISQLVICVTKLDSVGYSESCFTEVVQDVKKMLTQEGWKQAVTDTQVPFIPLAAWTGDNLVQPSEKMPWWKGCTVQVGAGGSCTVNTLADALNEAVVAPKQVVDAQLRMPITGVLKIKGVGYVVTGRITQGKVALGEELTWNTSSSKGKVNSCEMHHSEHNNPQAGDIIGLNLKGLPKDSMPRVGDVLCRSGERVKQVRSFTAQIMLFAVANELKIGWMPIGFVHTANHPVRLQKIHWRMNRDTTGRKMEEPNHLLPGDMASVEFGFGYSSGLQLEPFSDCQSLGRIALVDGQFCVAAGKVTAVTTNS